MCAKQRKIHSTFIYKMGVTVKQSSDCSKSRGEKNVSASRQKYIYISFFISLKVATTLTLITTAKKGTGKNRSNCRSCAYNYF